VADPVFVYDIAGLLVSAALAFVVAKRSASAYSLTGRSNLVNFSAGFACLGISYVGIAALIVFYPNNGPSNFLRLLIELLGFALIASSYYTRERKGSIGLLAGLVAAVSIALLYTLYFGPLTGGIYDGIAHLLEMAFALYTLVQISRSYTKQIVPGSFFVSWGFGALTLSQYTWVIWSYSDLLLTQELAMTIRLVGLVLLAFSLRK
jgi:hypothetical protein